MESPKNLLPLLFATIFFSGCAIGDFTPYSGQQQSWPTQPGSFVSTKYVIPAYIHSWPDRPYLVLGYLDATTAPIRRRGAVAFASRRAKELGADAIVVMQQGQEYAGSISTGSMLTGRVPFRGAPGEVMHQHQHAPLPLEQLKGVPQPLVVLLEMLLQKDHAKRPQSPAELLKGDGDDKRCHRGRAQNRSSEPAEDAPSRFGYLNSQGWSMTRTEENIGRQIAITGSGVFGREEDIAFLDGAWANQHVNVVIFYLLNYFS